MTPQTDGLVRYGAAILLKQLNIIQQELPGVRLAEDIECIHRTRVASRRLRAALPLFASSISARQAPDWKHHFRRLTRSLGMARDADVQIEEVTRYLQELPPGPERPGVRRLLLRLRQHRARLQKDLLKELDDFEESGVLGRMQERLQELLSTPSQTEGYSPSLYYLAHQSITNKRKAFLAYEPYVLQPEAIQELHAMRIAAKRLRYTMEIFAPLYSGELKQFLQSARKAQEYLGQIHDRDVWLQTLPTSIQNEQKRTLRYFGNLRPFKRLLPGFTAFESFQRDTRNRLYEEFVATWIGWQADGLWNQLLETIQPPTPASPDGGELEFSPGIQENRENSQQG